MGLALLGLWIVTAPAVLFFDPATFAPNRHGHIVRDPREFYQLFSDDVAYVAASRTLGSDGRQSPGPAQHAHRAELATVDLGPGRRWRGASSRLPEVLAVASYGILVAVMLMTGRLVARETGRVGPGLAAMVLIGTTSLMLTPAMWYSGGQPLWAGFGILSALWYAQSFRRNGRWLTLALAAVAGSVAGGFWSVGHLAGPVTAVYLWFDGRRRCRLAAAVPLGGDGPDRRPHALVRRAADRQHGQLPRAHGPAKPPIPIQGTITTAQAIPREPGPRQSRAGCGDHPGPGLRADARPAGLLGQPTLAATSRDPCRSPDQAARTPAVSSGLGGDGPRSSWPSFAFNPLECAGAALVLGCYLLEWTFRGYLDYHNLRTINPYVIVPWYDAIPQIGAVLFAAGLVVGTRPARTFVFLVPPAIARPGRPAPPCWASRC